VDPEWDAFASAADLAVAGARCSLNGIIHKLVDWWRAKSNRGAETTPEAQPEGPNSGVHSLFPRDKLPIVRRST
jgi:hypothetical protein